MKEYENKSITLAFVGDIMTHDNQIKAAYSERTGKYDFEGYFEEIKKYLIDSDISVCNFETTLGGVFPRDILGLAHQMI